MFVLKGLIRLYQWFISPLIGNTCIFYPSCSNYAINAIELHGVIKGSWLTVKRLLRCHSWNECGVDLVPRKKR